MPDTIVEKRTRSQVTLPDEILQVSQGSPLKDARTALRNHAISAEALPSTTPSGDDTDDELLLSPQKPSDTAERAHVTSKRSASPPPIDGYAQQGSPSDGRKLKRIKRDVEGGREGEDVGETDHTMALRRQTPTHIRNNSEPVVATGKRSSRKRAATISKKPISASSATPPPSSPPPLLVAKGRAQSVPLFPSLYPVLHIDLKNPPASPRRPRSRSPSKEREPQLRITSGTIPTFKALAVIPDDESGCGMDVDTEEPTPPIIAEGPSLPPPAPATPELQIRNVSPPLTDATNPENTTAIILSSSPKSQPLEMMPPASSIDPSPTSVEPPSTPLHTTSTFSMSLSSPLTPLPDTPHPSEIKFSAEARYTGPSGWGTDPETENNDITNSRMLKLDVPEQRSTKKQSRLPRPSIAPTPAETMSPAPAPPVTKKSVSNKPGPEAISSKMPNKLALAGSKKPSKLDAFAILMRKPSVDSKLSSKPDKGKEKATVGTSKATASSSTLKSGLENAATLKAYGKAKAKDKVEESKPHKMSLKAKMRPREKVKAKPVPVLVPLSGGETDDEKEIETVETDVEVAEEKKEDPEPIQTEVEPPRATSPAPTLPTSRPASPQQHDMDLSMQDVMVGSVVEHELPMVVPEPEAELKLPDVSRPEEAKSSDTEPVPTTAAEVVPILSESEGPEPALGPDSSFPETAPDTATPQAEIDTHASFRAGASKLPLGKKRVPIAAPAASRVTRSASSRQKEKAAEPSTSRLAYKKSLPVLVPPVSKKRTVSGTVRSQPPTDPEDSTSSLTDIATDPILEDSLPAGSPMKICSPTKDLPTRSFAKPTAASVARASLSKTPSKSKISMKSASSPSPMKLGRAASMFNTRPAAPLVRASSVDLGRTHGGAGGSSLSTLSNALEKLRMPPPARPNTSMGFNRDKDDGEDSTFDKQHSRDHGAVGSNALATARPSIRRAATVGPQEFVTGSSKAPATAATATSKHAALTSKPLVQKPLSSFMTSNDGPSTLGTRSLQSGTGAIMRVGKRDSFGGEKPRIFGVGGTGMFGMGARRPMQKASRNPGLPSVMASPVKGADGADADADDSDEKTGEASAPSKADTLGDVFISGPSGSETKDSDLADILTRNTNKVRPERPADAWKNNASRRASMASQMLSQSLSALPPQSSGRGLMGPPATPPRAGVRSSSSSYPSSSTSTSTSPRKTAAPATRTSSRLTKTAPGAMVKIRAGMGGHVSSSRKGAEEATASNPAAEALKILRDCVIFVDVRTDDGEEAGSLFLEMLEGVGAKILTRVGQTCTHIVYKNGLMSTLTRYRLLRNPKPLVVGIAWVVECVEQRKRVDETPFLVDLDEVNVAGTNKRRKSMLPKLISREIPDRGSSNAEQEAGNGDVSMDGSQSSISLDDDLPPLEKARRRRSMLVGPPP